MPILSTEIHTELTVEFIFLKEGSVCSFYLLNLITFPGSVGNVGNVGSELTNQRFYHIMAYVVHVLSTIEKKLSKWPFTTSEKELSSYMIAWVQIRRY